VAVSDALAPYLPGPVVTRRDGGFRFEYPERSIGRVRSYAGNFGVLVRAYTYIRAVGGDGLRDISSQAVLSANYLKALLADVVTEDGVSVWPVAYDRTCMHEFVVSGGPLRKSTGVRTLDVAKRLLDYGVHPPTVYFPLIVDEAMMVEPTETESKETLERFAAMLRHVAEEAAEDPGLVRGAPYLTPVRRLDEAAAVKNADVAWSPGDGLRAMTRLEGRWRLIVDGAARGAWNMAIDRAMLTAHAAGWTPRRSGCTVVSSSGLTRTVPERRRCGPGVLCSRGARRLPPAHRRQGCAARR